VGDISESQERYCFEDHCMVTDLVQEAIWELWKPEEMILCIRDPRQAPVADICERRGISTRTLWIGEGTLESDLWETFSRIGSVIRPGEEILFDITGGSHTLPIIMALVAVWVKEIHHGKTVGVIHATKADEFGMRHFVDMRSLMGVIDWIGGIQALISHTDASRFHTLLSNLQKTIYQAEDEPVPPTRMRGWAHLLGTFTTAVRLSRPVDALYAGWGVHQDLPRVREEIRKFAPTLLPVLDEMDEISSIGAPPLKGSLNSAYLMKQLRLIQYQIQTGLEMQAVSLSREWLISAVMIFLKIEDEWRNADTRHEVSRTLTGLALTLQGSPSETTPYTHHLLDIADWKELIKIWERVSDLRNDLAHCGMNSRDESLRSILQRTAELPDTLIHFGALVQIPSTTNPDLPED
jgi:hypothetical protein